MKYIDADQIRSEIEREMGEITYGVGEPKDVYTFCGELLDFLDTIPEQPVEGLEEEIDACWQNWLSPSNQKEVEEVLPKTEFATYARHFYELGCRRTAEMYDDIEYNRQRAEEAEISKGLEEEIERYCGPYNKRPVPDFIDAVARHFAEWGTEHLKR